MKNKNSKYKNQAQTMVEFALVLPILALLIFGLLEVGRMAFLYSTIATASREAVRYGSATGDKSTGNTTKRYADCAGIRAAAQSVDFLNVIDDNNIIISYYHTTNPLETPFSTCPVGGPGPTNIKSGDRIGVVVSGDFNPIVGLVPLSARTITSSNFHTLLGSVMIVQPGFCPYEPTILDTDPDCVVPIETPTVLPTAVPTAVPTVVPTAVPTDIPTETPSATTVTISGIITGGGAGTTLTYDGGSTIADGSGNYIITVASGWSGTVTPSKAGFIFNPVISTYSNITSNKIQNYIASAQGTCYDITRSASNPNPFSLGVGQTKTVQWTLTNPNIIPIQIASINIAWNEYYQNSNRLLTLENVMFGGLIILSTSTYSSPQSLTNPSTPGWQITSSPLIFKLTYTYEDNSGSYSPGPTVTINFRKGDCLSVPTSLFLQVP